jgi:hypothetical protein
MKTKILLIVLFLSICPLAYCNQSYTGWCTSGAYPAVTSNLNSTNTLQTSYGSCQVAVYVTGTTTLATLFSDTAGDPLSNPFTAGTDGKFQFFIAVPSSIDITMSGGTGGPFGGGMPAPYTISDVTLSGVEVNPSTTAGPLAYYATPGSVVSPAPGITYNPTLETTNVFDLVTQGPVVNVQSPLFAMGSPIAQITLGGNIACSQTSKPVVTFSAPAVAGGVPAVGDVRCNTGNSMYVVQMQNEGSGYDNTATCSLSGVGVSGATCSVQLLTPGPADPTGVACSNSAIMSAIGYAIGQVSVNGVIPMVYIPTGTYLLCAPLDIPQSIIVRGDGSPSTMLTHNGDFPEIHIWNPGNSIAGSSIANSWVNLGGVYGMTLLGRGVTDTADLFEGNGGPGLKIGDVNILLSGGFCLNLSGMERINITDLQVSVCRYPEIFQGDNEVHSTNNSIASPGFTNDSGTTGSGINTVNGVVMNQFSWNGGTLTAASTDGSGGAAFSVTASVSSPIVTGMWFQVLGISDLTSLNGTWQATNILNNCSAASSPYNSSSTCANFASGQFVAIATLTSGFAVSDVDWRGIILQNPTTATPSAGSSSGLSSATWKPAVWPQYNPAIWTNESEMQTFVRSSIKSTALSACLQSMSSPVEIKGFYCEAFTAAAINPGYEAGGAFPYTKTTTLITPGPVVSPTTVCAGTTPCTVGVVSDNWFPNVSSIPYPNEYGDHFMRMSIIPCDYNPAISTQSSCAPTGVMRNMFEVAGIVFIKPGNTGLVLSRNLPGSTAPNFTIWPIGSILGFINGSSLAGSFSGLNTGIIVEDVDHVTAPDIATFQTTPAQANYAYMSADNGPWINATQLAGVVPDYVVNFPVGTAGQGSGITGNIVLNNALAAAGTSCIDSTSEYTGVNCVKVVGNGTVEFFGNVINQSQLPENATDLATCTAYQQFSFPVIFANYGGVNSIGKAHDATLGTTMIQRILGGTSPCEFKSDLVSNQSTLTTQFGTQYFIQDVGPAGGLGFSNRWVFNGGPGNVNGFSYVTSHDGSSQQTQFSISATLATGVSEVALSDHLNQINSNGLGGTCTMSSSTSCTLTLQTTFIAQPVCQVTARGTTAIAGACSVSGTTVTVTAASSNSLTWNVSFIGNPN